jgi:hypothetical protein
MLNMLLIIILFILIIFSNLTESMTDNYNKYLNNITSILLKNNVYKEYELIEITSLPLCNKTILVDYGLNINTINNNNISINQIINDPLINTIEVDNENYNLLQVEWRNTNFTFNNTPIGITLHLIHSDYKTSNKLNIIIPLDFVEDVDNIESFKNVFYNKMDTYFTPATVNNKSDTSFSKNENKLTHKFRLNLKYKRKYNIKKINTNLLLNEKNNIPIYQCCKNTIGTITQINLCILKNIIESNNKFYIIKEENGNTNLITEPNIINEEAGLFIKNNIQKDENLIYLK